MSSLNRLESFNSAVNPEDFVEAFAEVQEAVRKDPFRKAVPSKNYWSEFAKTASDARRNLWVLHGSPGELKGRISANISDSAPVGGKKGELGYVGCFEAQDWNTAEILIGEATRWLKAQGAKQVLGPINWNTWFSYRFRVEAEDALYLDFEPINPPEYPKWFREMGFEINALYNSLGMDGVAGMMAGTETHFQKALSLGYSFRPFDQKNLLEVEVPILHDLSMRSFQDNYLFEAIDLEDFRSLYVPLVKKVDLSLSHYLCNPDGVEVGFFFNFLVSQCLVMKTTALVPEERGAGLSNALFHQVTREALARGVTTSIGALMKDGIQSESYTRKQKVKWKHQYALFSKIIG